VKFEKTSFSNRILRLSGLRNPNFGKPKPARNPRAAEKE